MIMLIALVAVVSVMPVNAETLEVRGTIEELDAANPTLVADRVWDYSSFTGFWYDMDDNLQTESLTILAIDDSDYPTLGYHYDDRTLDEGTLIYRTHPAFQEYELYENEGLTVESANLGGDTGYYAEGWMAEEYVAIDNNADKLCKLLAEFEDDDKKTLSTGEEWYLGGGFVLVPDQIDLEGDKVWFSLYRDGKELDSEVISCGSEGDHQDRVYTYTSDIGWEEDIPVFSCYVDAIFRGPDSNIVQVTYVFLIDDDVLEIETSQTYGAMEVMTASSSAVVLTNDAPPIDLDTGTTEHIMGSMYFKTADDDSAIRFYPMVEYTEPGTYEIRGTIEELDAINPTLGYDRVWDYSNFAGFWYELDDNLCSEDLTILANNWTGQPTLDFSTGDRTLDETTVIYRTHPVFREYELHENEMDPDRTSPTTMEMNYLNGKIGLCVESDKPGGDCGYFIESWMAEECVAIDGNADKLTKLLVGFEDDDKKTLATGEEWDLGGGFSLTANQINLEGDKVWFSLKKDGREIDNEVASTGAGSLLQDRVYTYTADIGGEVDIPVFSCYVDGIFRGTDSNIVQVMYVFLIDDDVLEIDIGDTYGIMEVMTASRSGVTLRNNENTLDLDTDTKEHIMGNLYIKTADDDTTIRFYPFVERTIGGEGPTPPATIPAKDIDGDGVPDVWDADNNTPSDYWVNSDGIGRKWGDMNGDGELTSADALMILQAAVGKIELG